MTSLPIGLTFPIDVRSPGGTAKLDRLGCSVPLVFDPSQVAINLAASILPFFAVLGATMLRASATVQAAVSIDSVDQMN